MRRKALRGALPGPGAVLGGGKVTDPIAYPAGMPGVRVGQ
jgi:hypothetical protein